MNSSPALPHCETVTLPPGSPLPDWLLNRSVPVKLNNYVEHWPAVEHSRNSDRSLCGHLLQFYTGEPMGFFFADPSARGRFFYNEDLTGFNFEKVAADLGLFLKKLLESTELKAPPGMYIGGTHLQHYLPGFCAQNPPVPVPSGNIRNGLWVGNRTRVAIHQDLPLNIACCVAGRRKFTLFPPSQTPHLYIGPLDFTPSGQPVSLVDLHNIDHDRYPLFKQALQHGLVAELSPGDALFVPSMWWHEVEALAPFNVLVNYWWRTTPAYADAPVHALHHALLSIAGLPAGERQIWQDIFNHYVFNDDAKSYDHIPPSARGILGDMDEDRARQLRSLLLQSLQR